MRKFFATVAMLACLAVTQVHAGIIYTSVTKNEGPVNPQAPNMNMTMKGSVEGDMMKMEFSESSNPIMKAGSYMLTKNAGKLMYMVIPTEKSYMEWDLERLMSGMKSMMNMKFSSPKIDKSIDEAGPTMFGYPTRHYKFITVYTMEMNMMGMKMNTNIKKEEEIWATEKLNHAGFKAWAKAANMKTGDEELDKLIESTKSKIQGFPLKTININTTTDHTGNTHTSKTITEVTEIKESQIPASTFEIPAGYVAKAMPVLQLGGSGNSKGNDAGALPNSLLGGKK
ncbi:MAG: hypothetical protein A2283_13205 [Lentisphaerae bacterium RIFOXYA12_FULL_48_11]|nr:MAG: hypothetical protein A2283_13205 [Lentisphaerae bacterium RIFOXYA12_FULL_48_11]